jgi:NAD(P)-dependent dehydrogenase (short-subunit alcohol dehydrogenase family)
MMDKKMARKSIVITGCSSGFGRYTALEMARSGWHVFGTVRKEADRDNLLQEATTQGCQQNLTPLLCDITKHEEVMALVEQVQEILRAEAPEDQHVRTGASPVPTINAGLEINAGLDALMNNAGSAYAAPIEMMPLEDLREQLELNVVAHIGVIQAFLPMLKAAHGTIINISSVSGRISVPVTGAYSASKFALEGISEALRLELAPFGVKVVLIEPASSPTSIWQTSLERAMNRVGDRVDSSPYKKLLQQSIQQAKRSSQHGFPPQRVATLVRTILATSQPRARYGVPASATTLMFVRRVFPDRMWDFLIRLYLHW